MTEPLPMLTAMLSGAILLIAGSIVNPHPLYIWNASESIPVGLYRLQPSNKRYVTELVAVRPPEPLASFLELNGYLPAGVPMLKRVLALSGQTVCRQGRTILVDDIVVGAAQERDSRGRPLPEWQGCTIVSDDELFLMNWQSENSLDGRYFGLMPVSSVIGRAIPVWTKQD
jgi:conjugative transfer signal peptidase TraF